VNVSFEKVPGPIVRPLAPAFGAEVRGVDLRALDETGFEAIQAALNRYSVIVLPDQELSPPDQINFTKRLGPLHPKFFNPQTSVPGFVELSVLSNMKVDGRPIGDADAGRFWHSDMAFKKIPDIYSLLYALEVPVRDGEVLGDTLFASTAAAYDGLPAAMKKRISGLTAIHSIMTTFGKRKQVSEEKRQELPDVEHPVVRTHPITGRKCIYVSEGHTASIVGMPEDESRELLKLLHEHTIQPQYMYRHKWRVGDLLIWDNCATLHRAEHDYGDIPRRMHRGGVLGSVPV